MLFIVSYSHQGFTVYQKYSKAVKMWNINTIWTITAIQQGCIKFIKSKGIRRLLFKIFIILHSIAIFTVFLIK